MLPTTLIEVLDAAHVTHLVSSPFLQRGGIILVAPPGHLKTTFITAALRGYQDKLLMSDINVKTLMELRNDMISGKYQTLAFTALEKLYARASRTSDNIEATLMAMVEEGFTRAAFEDQRGPMRPSRALVVGGTFPDTIEKMWNKWEKIGFTRRFIWINYSLKNPKEILKAIHRWQLLDFGMTMKAFPIADNIPYDMNDRESSFVLDCLKGQAEATPLVLMKKIYCVLKWKYQGDADKAKEILSDFAQCLEQQGTFIELPLANKQPKSKPLIQAQA